jgi:uncharacterized NAD(P)/FAD-binding protein YdhS
VVELLGPPAERGQRSPTVAVVGGGASGVLAATRVASRAASPVQILLVEPASPGRGVAYATDDPRHRLNVPAGGMSAWPEDPEHFLRFLRAQADPDAAAGDFAPRPVYARYLRSVLNEALRSAPHVRFEHRRTTARSLHCDSGGWRITLADSSRHPIDAIVLATGNGRPSTTWAPPALLASPRFIADPWAAPPPRPRPGSTVLIVGAGLTATDMVLALHRPGVQLHAISRHGLLPLPHTLTPAPRAEPPTLPDGPITAAEARRLVFAHIRALGGDWRRAVDSLRPHNARLWTALGPVEQARWLESDRRRWDQARHRVDPRVHATVDRLRASGELQVHAAAVAGARTHADRLLVGLDSGVQIEADLVVNCTGSGHPSRDEPFLRRLITDGWARSGPFGLGVATSDGQLIARDGRPVPIWALGPLRQGELWETTAIPEIRVQAANVANAVVAGLEAAQLETSLVVNRAQASAPKIAT